MREREREREGERDSHTPLVGCRQSLLALQDADELN